MSWADTAAVVAVIQSVPSLVTAVYVTKAPKPTAPATALPLPYVIVHPQPGRDEQSRFAGPPVLENPKFTLHLVGVSGEQALAVLDLVKPKFHTDGFVTPPVVSGRSNKNGYWDSPVPVQVDTDVTPSLVYAVIELGWTSEPA